MGRRRKPKRKISSSKLQCQQDLVISNANEILRHLRWKRNETSVSIKSRISVKGFDFPLKAKLELIFLTLSVIMVTSKLWVVITAVIPNNSIFGFSNYRRSAFHHELAVDHLDWGRGRFCSSFHSMTWHCETWSMRSSELAVGIWYWA